MRAVGVIPARYGSTRFPAKMLADLGGQALVLRTVARARQARLLDDVLLATDDGRIADVARAAGVPFRMTRVDHPSGTDRIAEAVEGLAADVVVNIQGDEPFIEPSLIDDLVTRMRDEPDLDMATASTPILEARQLLDPSVVKVVCDERGRALYFSRSLIPASRDEPPETHLASGIFQRHLGLYAYRRDYLLRLVTFPPHPLEILEKLEQLRALAHGARMAVLRTRTTAPGIDTEEDLRIARERWQAQTESSP